MKQLKSWFFSNVRGLNPRNKFINLADFGEPDQITFTDLLDTALTKKIDAFNYQDQATPADIDAKLDGDKFVNPAGLPELMLVPGTPLTLIINAASFLTPRNVYHIQANLADNNDIFFRVPDKLVTPANLPIVEADPTPGNPITVTASTIGAVTTYQIFSSGGGGDFVLKTGDTMTGALNFVTGTGNAYVAPDELYLEDTNDNIVFDYFGGSLNIANYDLGNFVELSSGSGTNGSDFLKVNNVKNSYLLFKDDAGFLTDTDIAYSRLYARNGFLRFRKVGQNFETAFQFTATLGRTLVFPDKDGTIAVTTDFKLSSLQPATANNIISNGNFTQTWQWSLSGGVAAFTLKEAVAASIGQPTILSIETLPGSTAFPFTVTAQGNPVIIVDNIGTVSVGATGLIIFSDRVAVQRGFEYNQNINNTAGALNDFNVSLGTYFVFKAATSISGFTAPASSGGKILVITNNSGGPITIIQAAGSALANQIFTSTGANINLVNSGTLMFIYDADVQKWRTITN